MSVALGGAVELLDRALAYTRVVLADVNDDQLGRPTPCAAWTLDTLLAHMEDSLDAFTEAASGVVEVSAVAPAHGRVVVLQQKACALLGAWSRSAPDGPDGPDGAGYDACGAADRASDIAVGDLGLAGPLLVATAALEITVHGWDVGRATGRDAPIPDDLARLLLVVARRVVDAQDRGVRFDPPRSTPVDASHAAQLLAFLGRR